MSKIILYSGYGTSSEVEITGHLFKSYSVKEVFQTTGGWRNAVNALRRYRIQVNADLNFSLVINGKEFNLKTNENGYFVLRFTPLVDKVGWHDIEIIHEGRAYTNQFLIVDPGQTIIISDVDDTLMYSMVHQFWTKLKLLIFKNGLQRDKVPQFDQIQNELISTLGPQLTPNVFYVSNSEWNLHGVLTGFFKAAALPKGVLLLNKLKIGLRALIFNAQHASAKGHKSETIQKLFDQFSDSNFILIGDTGQFDPKIYADVAAKNAVRIQKVILRYSGRKSANDRNQLEINRIRSFNVECSVLA